MGERIERAAIREDGEVYSVPRPGRHHDVIRSIVAARPETKVVSGDQGFVTSTGRFVDRREAADIARAAGQIIEAEQHRRGLTIATVTQLFSEDVW